MKSYDEILKSMMDKYTEKTGTNADDASDIGIRMRVLAGEVYNSFVQLEWLKTQMFPQTATGEYLDMHAAQRGITRKSGTKAVGEVCFYIEKLLDYDVDIPEGIICSTSGDDPVRFVTTEAVTIMSGRLATIAPVEAVRIGADGNVDAQEICLMVTPVAGVKMVMNDYRIENGSDDETDEQLRQRIVDSFINIPNGTNKAFYEKSTLEVDGVTAVGIVPRGRGIGTLDVYIMSADGEPSDELINAVQEHLDEVREVNVDILVQSLNKSGINVYVYLGVKSGYSFEDVKARCEEAVNKYFSLLSAGETFYLSELGEFIRHTEGVKNYSFDKNLCSDTNIATNSIAVPNKILIMERGE